MNREMTTVDLIQLLRKSRTARSSWLPVWEDLARGHYRQIRSSWIRTNKKTLKEWQELELSIQPHMWQAGNYAEEWLRFAYHQIMPS